MDLRRNGENPAQGERPIIASVAADEGLEVES